MKKCIQPEIFFQKATFSKKKLAPEIEVKFLSLKSRRNLSSTIIDTVIQTKFSPKFLAVKL